MLGLAHASFCFESDYQQVYDAIMPAVKKVREEPDLRVEQDGVRRVSLATETATSSPDAGRCFFLLEGLGIDMGGVSVAAGTGDASSLLNRVP